MKRFILLLAAASVILGITSCDVSNDKAYDGPAQVAFEKAAYSVKLTGDQTYNVKVQFITSEKNNKDIPVKIALSGDAVGSIVTASSVPTAATIKAGEYSVAIPIQLSFAGATTTAKSIILTLSADNVKVAANFAATTISIKK
jgi:hypothetical protein